MEKLETLDQFTAHKLNGTTIFLFSADWCPDCRFIDPFMPEVTAKFPDFKFVYVDRDQFIDLCAENDVYGIPSFIAFRDGNEIGRFVSKERKTQEEIEAFIGGLV